MEVIKHKVITIKKKRLAKQLQSLFVFRLDVRLAAVVVHGLVPLLEEPPLLVHQLVVLFSQMLLRDHLFILLQV